ncbi:MAG: hypothetical protein J6J33_04020, partial [Clostridia bacterium]|nr:hypothetical protein [Clostridia bacterium]
PLGIKAIESMQKDNLNKDTATFSMIMFVAISCSSIQLLPTSIIGMLANAGSKKPSSIILPSLLCSLLSTIITILLVYLFSFIHKKFKKK